ncbi:4-alpha-glucanotransferase [Cutibacterium acnes]|jgi:4-alpha-glucanotransferase
MSLTDPHLTTLADHFGIARDYYDWKGQHTEVGEATVIAVLDGLGIDASTPERAERACHEVTNRKWRRVLPGIVVLREGQEGRVDVHVNAGEWVEVHVVCEDGQRRECWQVDNWNPDRHVDDRWIGEATFGIPGDLPLGYHTIVATTADHRATSTLVVSPNWLGLPRSMGSSRVWGHAVQLYSTRSRASWGMGDFSDLADLSTWAATQGADYVLVNPLHASQVVSPIEPSPYLPCSRLFLNPLYVRPEIIPEYADLDVYVRSQARSARAQAAADAEAIDRDRSWNAKLPVLEAVHALGLEGSRELSYQAFRRLCGTRLEDLATWCALTEVYGNDWRTWPEEYQRPSNRAVSEFVRAHEERVDFFMWLQWIADQQLSAAQSAGRDAGMSLGLMCDMAVGVSGAGADAWMLGKLFADGVCVGSPPDAFNQAGQEWGQPPMRPDILANLAYRPFRDMVRAALRHAGGIRIDHILGLFRLWWVPVGLGPRMGTYIRYDHEAMVGILALEAHRAGALVVGEDLGTVEPWVRAYLRERGIMGTSVLWFENGENGNPLPLEQWREYAMSSVTTHDLPPTTGYLAGDHVEVRHELGLLTESLEHERAEVARQTATWIAILRERGVLVGDDPSEEDIVLAMHRMLTRTPSKVLNATLTDAVGDRRTQNLPGTTNEYPNWRVPLSHPDGSPMWLDEVFTDERAARLSHVMNEK